MLEVLRILEAEINLREDTRVAEQARPALEEEEYEEQAARLTETQDGLVDRTRDVVGRILELPDAEAHFARDLALLRQVTLVMEDTSGILARPETGPSAIAGETEAIELLLQSKRINPMGSGGGGANPGGGGGGTTTDSALALLGTSTNPKEVREQTADTQTTGTSGAAYPPEWREGIDEYFNRLERARETLQ